MNAINKIANLKPDTLISNPAGTPVLSSVRVAAEASNVWAVVGDFGGFEKFIPALEKIDVTGNGAGSVRHKTFKEGGHVVIEQLNSRDDNAMSMTWSLVYNTLGIGNLWAAMTVVPDNKECIATWTIIGEPAEGNPASAEDFRNFLQGFADGAMSNVQKMFA